MRIIELFKQDVAIKTIESTGYPVFPTDIKKDEVKENPSFFIFSDDGDTHNGTSASQYLKEFVLAFVTKEDAIFNEIELIENLKKSALTFRGSSTDYGRIANTDVEAKMRTLTFVRTIQVR